MIEAGRVHADVATKIQVSWMLPTRSWTDSASGPSVPARHGLEAQLGGHAGHLAGVVRLHAADGDGVSPPCASASATRYSSLRTCCRRRRDAGVAVLALGPGIHARQRRRETRQRMDR